MWQIKREREKLLHRKITLILAICVCVYSSCCSTNSWENENKNRHSIYSLIYSTEHLGDEPVRGSLLAWEKRNTVLISKIPSFVQHEILPVNFRRPQRSCHKWTSCVKRFGIQNSRGLSELISSSWHSLICQLSQESLWNRCLCEGFHCIMILVSFRLSLHFQFDLKILLLMWAIKHSVVGEVVLSSLIARFSYL